MYWATLAVYEHCKSNAKIVPDFIVVDGSEGGTGALSLVIILEHRYVKAYVLYTCRCWVKRPS